MPWLAWLGGLGRPFWILNVYAALNLVFWIGFVVMMAVLFRPYGWAGLGGFSAMLMTCGIIESMRSSLTDFPGFVLMTLAMMVGGAGGAAVLALAALTREPSIIGIVGLWDYRPPWLTAARRNLVLALIAGLPVTLWFAYVLSRFPPAESFAGGDLLAWPMRGIMAKLGEFSVHAVNGDIHWSRLVFRILSQRGAACPPDDRFHADPVRFPVHPPRVEQPDLAGGSDLRSVLPLRRLPPLGKPLTVARHALPITLAFNLVLAMRAPRGWLAWFLLGNCFVPYGVYQFTIQSQGVTNPPAEYRIVPAKPPARPSVSFWRGLVRRGMGPK